MEAGKAAGVPVLTGHHRDYSPITATARVIVRGGALGSVVAVIGTALFASRSVQQAGRLLRGRRQLVPLPGGGPILLNLIHGVNNLLSLVGDIVRVQAVTSNATRGYPVEDTAAMVFTFANGALGTFLLSTWPRHPGPGSRRRRRTEPTPAYGDEDCYHIAGTRGSLSVPTMRLRVYGGKASWWEPFSSSVASVETTDPLANQLEHFAAVVRDGLKSLRLVDAVLESVPTGLPVDLDEFMPCRTAAYSAGMASYAE